MAVAPVSAAPLTPAVPPQPAQPPATPPPAASPPVASPPAAVTSQTPAAPAPDAYAPVIEVGGTPPSPTPAPGQPGSQLAPIWYGRNGNQYAPPGDDKVQRDFMASRSLAQAGNPWGNLDALIGTPQAGAAGKQPPGGKTATTPGTQPEGEEEAGGEGGEQGAVNDPSDERPVGTKLVDAASDLAEAPGDELDLSSIVGPVTHAAGAIGKDVATGVAETPQAALRGMLGAAQQTAKLGLSVRDAIDQVLPNWLLSGLPGGAMLGGAAGKALEGVEQGAGAAREALPEPSSVTGNLVEQGVQFGVGLKGAGAVTEGMGRVAPFLNNMIAGATTMDPEGPRLSTVLDDIAPNFLTSWLKAKPGQDTAEMGRLKSGLEFAGLGALFEGLRHGLTAIKAAVTPSTGLLSRPTGAQPRGVQTTEVPRPQAMAEGPEGVIPPEWERQPLVQITPRMQGMAEQVAEQQAGLPRQPPGEAAAPAGGAGETFTGAVNLSPEEVADYVAGRNADNPIRINLLRIGSGDDIQNILEEVARTIPEPSVQSNEATIRAADAAGLTPGDFLAGYQGQNLNAAQTTAMRFVLDSSAQQLIGFAKAATDPLTGTPEAQATFLRAFAIHRSLQEYFVNARAEAGRTLQAWSIMSQQRAGYTQAIQKVVQQAGQQNVSQMAADIASLDDPLQVSRLVAASERGSGRDTFLKVFYNVLLSNPRTVVKKLASDASQVMWNLTTNYAAERMGSGAIAPGETAQLGYGYISSLKDSIIVAGKGLKAGESQFFKQFQTMDWQDKSRLSLLANGAPEAIGEEAPTQAGAAWLRAALPTSWIGAADDFAKYMNYRAYVRGLSYRDGVNQGMAGPDLATHIQQSMDNVPDSIHQEALTNALRSTFQEPLTGVAAKFQDIADSINVPVWHSDFQLPVGRIIMPFIKVPTNIMRWSYRNTVLAKMFPSQTFQQELNAGGATRDLAMARVWLGSAVALSMTDLALNNVITGRGPANPRLQGAWRDAGNQPYSIQLPGQRPVSYNQVEPLGLLTGAIADTFNVMRFARDDDRENLAAALAFGTGNAILSKTYMQGIANLFEGMNDPERSGDRIAQSMALPFVSPQGVAAAAHAMDPWVRSHYSFIDNIESRLPIVSENLPPQRDELGDPVPQKDAYLPFMPTDSFVPRFVSPWSLGPDPANVDPIKKWLWDKRDTLAHSTIQFDEGEPTVAASSAGTSAVISRPPQTITFGRGQMSVPLRLTAKQYDQYQALAGNELKLDGVGAKDLLNRLVTGTGPPDIQNSWNRSSDAQRVIAVQHIVNTYRNAAKQALLNIPENAGLVQAIRDASKARSVQLQPH